ncbi:MAG: AAA family ATPase [Spirochaetales bacterium]|nr:AAA family ATPase [Spirochaetales bacterium]
MFLKSVEIFGFKSFADRMTIDFRDGISAILGPNGCGKSNVVDSIKWVLGSSKSKDVRAEKKEDVIFNGTEVRKRLNVAEVTLVISNEMNLLPIDISEISIKRRIYRSGESEYYINGVLSRHKDVRELFLDTGIGKSAYSILEQGKIDQILSNKPEERRYLFEEAAGISKYKIKRLEAERKLEKTEENIRQVEGIINEVKKSHDSLLKQAEKAERYRILKEEIFNLELDIQLLRLKALLEDKNNKELDFEEKIEAQKLLKAEIEEIDSLRNQGMGQVHDMELSLSEMQKQIYGLGVEKESIDDQISMLKEQKLSYEEQLVQRIHKEEAIKAKLEEIEAQIKDKEWILEEFEKRLEDVTANIDEFEENIQTSEEKIEDNRYEMAELNRKIRESQNMYSDFSAEMRNITEEIVLQLDSGLNSAGYSRSQKDSNELLIKQSIESLKSRLDSKGTLLEDILTLKDVSLDKTKKYLVDLKGSMQDFYSDINQLTSSFEKYSSMFPNFLDEFLAPEGIITKKRIIDEKMETLLEEIDQASLRINEIEEENHTLTLRVKEYRATLDELKGNASQMKSQKAGFIEQHRMMLKQQADQKLYIEQNQKEIEEYQAKVDSLTERVLALIDRRNDICMKEDSLRDQLESIRDEIVKSNSELNKNEKRLVNLNQDVNKLQVQLEKLQMSLVSVKSDIQNVYNNFRERHSRDLTEFVDKMYEISIPTDELKSKLSSSRDGLKELGSVNLMAPQEYKEVKERYDFLRNQVDDLINAREQLKEITIRIEKESTELFLDTYEKIKRNFHNIFRRLFGGGRAEIKLLDTEDVLDSGIEIYAQPPGKSLENIGLLSGGERSMTAVALLFATYMVRPAPFCILDEIDAALDERNIIRFTTMLQEFAENSQFIIITHNKKTVTAAKTLIGVTMQESGVSKIISVRLEGDGGFVDEEREEEIQEA